MIFGGGLMPSTSPQPFLDGEVVYLPAAFFTANFDQFLFWDAGADALIITTRDDNLVFHVGQTRFYANGIPQNMQHPILNVDGVVFMPASLAEALYPIIVHFNSQYNLVVVEDATIPHTTAELTRRTDIRFREDNNAPIAVRVPAGETVTVFEERGEFTRVRTGDGLLGWALTSSLGEPTTVSPLNLIERETLLGGFIFNSIHPPNWPAGRPVVMAWDSVSSMDANYARMQVPLYNSLNVIAPTWFSLNEGATILTSIVSREYVEWANESGVQVWPSFEIPGDVRNFLTDRVARQRIIGQLVGYVDELGLGGINIDFEPRSPIEGPYFIQFLRELAPPLRTRGAVLSVNTGVRESAFYERSLLAYTVDFVIIMAQDEYGHDSEISGPVASVPFVQRSIENLLEYVPREQLVLALPFYNRVWREIVGNNTPETRQLRHFGVAYTRDWFDYSGAEWEWLPDIGNYYGEFTILEDEDVVRYRVWLECERSIDVKLQICQANNLAGVAVWNRNFRNNEELWDVMGRFFP